MKRPIIWLLTVSVSVGLLAARNRFIIDTSESPYAKLRSLRLQQLVTRTAQVGKTTLEIQP